MDAKTGVQVPSRSAGPQAEGERTAVGETQLGEGAEALPTETVDVLPVRRKGRKKGTKVKQQGIKPRQMSKLLECTAKGMPVEQAARAAKLPPSTAHRALQRYAGWLQELDEVKDFEATRNQLLSAGELRVFKSMMTGDKIEKASFNNLAYGLRQIHDMRRLEQGLSTANHAHQHTKVEISAPDYGD